MKIVGIAILAAMPALALVPWPAVAECPRIEDAAYVGSKSCQKCHFKEYGSWQKTKMAKAFETLKPNAVAEEKKKIGLDPARDYTKDAKCVACHVTGYGKKGGYPAIVEGKAWSDEEKARAPLMEGVGCESCHGPGEKANVYKKDNKDYKWTDVAKLGMFHPTEASCTTCHNKESPTFKEFKFADKIGTDTHEILKLKQKHDCDHPHMEGK